MQKLFSKVTIWGKKRKDRRRRKKFRNTCPKSTKTQRTLSNNNKYTKRECAGRDGPSRPGQCNENEVPAIRSVLALSARAGPGRGEHAREPRLAPACLLLGRQGKPASLSLAVLVCREVAAGRGRHVEADGPGEGPRGRRWTDQARSGQIVRRPTQAIPRVGKAGCGRLGTV